MSARMSDYLYTHPYVWLVGCISNHAPIPWLCATQHSVSLGKLQRHALALRSFRKAAQLEPNNGNYNANKQLAQKKERDERGSGQR